jgi:hypothetical protein
MIVMSPRLRQRRPSFRPVIATGGEVNAIEFTGPDYTNGNLNGQDGWVGDNNWQVNTSGSGSTTLGVDGFRNLTRTAEEGAKINLAVGDSVSFRTVVQLAGTPITPTENVFLMDFGIGTTATAASYVRLRLNTDGTVGIAGDDPNSYVGMDIAEATGRLAIDTTWTRGPDTGFGSTLSFQLTNLDTNVSTAVGTRAWGTNASFATLFDLVTGEADVGAYRRAHYDTTNTGVTGITMLSTDVVTIP